MSTMTSNVTDDDDDWDYDAINRYIDLTRLTVSDILKFKYWDRAVLSGVGECIMVLCEP